MRRYSDGKNYVADMVYDVNMESTDQIIHHTDINANMSVDPSWEYEDLLVPMLRDGKDVYEHPPLKEMRARTKSELDKFDPSIRRFLNPQPFFSGIEKNLYERKIAMIEEIRKK